MTFVYRQTVLGLVATAAFSAFSFSAAIADGIPAKKMTEAELYLTASEAAEMLNDQGVLFVDVRSQAEVALLGIPERANVNIPLKILAAPAFFDVNRGTYAMIDNPDFAEQFMIYAGTHGFTTDSRIILICRSGSRSARAADMLFAMGYENVYSVIDGFEGDKKAEGPEKGHRTVNGWQNSGLEWSYYIRSEQVYPKDAS